MLLIEVLKHRNIGLIDFKEVFLNIETLILNDCLKYGLIVDQKLDVAKTDTKKLVLHYIIHNVCESIIKTKMGKKCVLLVKDNFLDDTEIIKYCEAETLYNLIQDNIKQLSKLLPIPIFFIQSNLLEQVESSGEVMEFKCMLTSKLEELDNKTYSFKKIRKFCMDNGLEFLTNDYFTNIISHQILR